MAKAVVLISGGIDSPVAAYIAAKKGLELVLVHCINVPEPDEKYFEKMKKIALKLSSFAGKKIKIICVEHHKNQEDFMKSCDSKYTCIYCKRFMYKIAEQIAGRENAQLIVTGENLGQVASQTLENLKTLQEAVKMPILRPLIAMDKQEIIDIAKKIGTYDISISEVAGCPRLPKKISTAAKLKKIKEEEGKINVKDLIKNAVETCKEMEY